MCIRDRYIEELMEKSTPDRPIWNIEKIMQGLKSTWNYIDGCMIKAILEMYAIIVSCALFYKGKYGTYIVIDY